VISKLIKIDKPLKTAPGQHLGTTIYGGVDFFNTGSFYLVFCRIWSQRYFDSTLNAGRLILNIL
jgi:hypothetical protein